MTEPLQELPGSVRDAPHGMRSTGRVPGSQDVLISLYLKPRRGEEDAGAIPAAFQSRTALAGQRATEHADDCEAIRAFARTAGLTVVHEDPARRLVQLSGTVSAMEQAFGTQLHHYEGNGTVCRARHGALHAPADIVPRLTAILGLDTRPVATPKIVPHKGPTPPAGFLPTAVATLYGLGDVDASGQTIGIIELGGGYTEADNQAAFAAMGLTVPDVVAVAVDGTDNDPGDTSGANGEVALDIQVAGGVAPGARIAVYFAPNTDQGFVDAITQATHDQTQAPSVLSISWGSAESGWTAQAIGAMGQAFEDAAALGRDGVRGVRRQPRDRRCRRRQGACRLSGLRPARAGVRWHQADGVGHQHHQRDRLEQQWQRHRRRGQRSSSHARPIRKTSAYRPAPPEPADAACPTSPAMPIPIAATGS